MAGTSPAMTKRVSRSGTGTRQKIFSIFVDRIFTTSLQAPFTNVFDVIAAIAAIACLCRARHAD
jgi:hypothetical protein